jgi:hypothetical protein
MISQKAKYALRALVALAKQPTGKPVFIGEAGLQLPETAGSTAVRAEQLTAKMSAAFRAGVVGYLLWGWADPPRVGVTLDDDIHDIGPGDPVLATLAATPSSWPDDGGDSDNDGVSTLSTGAGYDDHAGTTGSITNANGLTAVILDAPLPSQGVTISVPSVGLPVRAMTVSACGVPVEIDRETSRAVRHHQRRHRSGSCPGFERHIRNGAGWNLRHGERRRVAASPSAMSSVLVSPSPSRPPRPPCGRQRRDVRVGFIGFAPR